VFILIIKTYYVDNDENTYMTQNTRLSFKRWRIGGYNRKIASVQQQST